MDDQPDSEETTSTLYYETTSPIISNESKKTRSVIWTHYSWDPVINRAKCNYCRSVTNLVLKKRRKA